jgi:hypothetical protein
MGRFMRVKEILDSAVGGPTATVGGPHRAFWRSQTRDQFVAFSILGLPIVTLGDGDGSNIVKALRGEDPFGQDTGNPDGVFRRMPAGRPPVPADEIALIARWIDDGAPEDEAPLGPLELRLGGAPSGEGFVVVSAPTHPLPATLSLRTTDGSEGDVRITASQGSATTLEISPSAVHVSGTPVEVRLLAATASNAKNDTTVEVVQGTGAGAEVLATLDLTAIAAPVVRFSGRFQCRLATDPDPFDHPWGEQSSFGMYAVQGPDPADPDEPPLDRVIRFQDGVALRPFCAPIGVSVMAVEAEVGGSTIRFSAGDALIGLPVRLGPGCKFDSRNRTFAPDGFEPISDFSLQIGPGGAAVFAGKSAPAVPRPSPDDPPGSTAPYADGITLLDTDPRPWEPSDFGYQEASWAEHVWALLARKLARLIAQAPVEPRDARIRDRRIREHIDTRPGHGLGALGTPLQLMERYTGLIDRELVIAANPVGALAYLATLPAVGFSADFFDFDTDCQTGTVTGTLGAPASVSVASPRLAASPRIRRRVPLTGFTESTGPLE